MLPPPYPFLEEGSLISQDILSVWKLARGPLLFVCVCVCVCVCFAWGNGPEGAVGKGSPVVRVCVCVCVLLGAMAPRGHLAASASAFLGILSVHLLHVRNHSLLAVPVQCYHVEGR